MSACLYPVSSQNNSGRDQAHNCSRNEIFKYRDCRQSIEATVLRQHVPEQESRYDNQQASAFLLVLNGAIGAA